MKMEKIGKILSYVVYTFPLTKIKFIFDKIVNSWIIDPR